MMGGEVKKLEGVPVRIFNPAKTVADCFKYRNKIGLDVAIERVPSACADGGGESVINPWAWLSRGLPEGLALEAGQDLRKVSGIGIELGEQQPHLAHRDLQPGTDHQQLEADRCALGARGHTAFQPEAAQRVEQHIGKGGEVQA